MKIFFLFFNFAVLLSCHGYCQQYCSNDTIEQRMLMRYFKHIGYEKQVAIYDSLSWCDKLTYFEKVTNLPPKKRKKISAVFYTCMLESLIYQTHYTTCDSGHLGYMWTIQIVRHDIAIWRKILSCE